MKILIGYDGSVHADGALYELERAGLPAQAEAVVLSVTTPWVEYESPHAPRKQVWPGSAARSQYRRALEQSLKETRDLAERGGRFLRGIFPGWKIKAEAAMEGPAEGILKKAEAWKPDLIVLGSHGRSALGRLLLGSVSQKVLHHSPVTVRITRARLKAGKQPLRLLVGMDGSADAQAAIEVVASRSWPKQTEVRLLGVVDTRTIRILPVPDKPGKGRLPAFPPGERAWLEKKVGAAAARLAAAGLRALPTVLEGDPRDILLQEAEQWGARCIFLGSRGLHAVERFLLGSISSAVAAHAPCTVEIVRPRKRKQTRRRPG